MTPLATTAQSDHSGRPRLWPVLIAALIASAIALALALWLSSEYRRSARASAQLENIYQRQLHTEALFSDVQDAETGQRGYIITGDRDFLMPYLAARQNIGGKVSALSKVIDGDRRAQDELRALVILIDRKFAELQRVVDLRGSQGTNPAHDAIRSRHGKQLMDGIRLMISRMKQANAQAMGVIQAREANRTDLSERLVWAGVAFIFLMSVGTAVLVWKSRDERYLVDRAAHDAATRQHAIFDNAFDAIILINPSGSIEVMNRAAERLFGFPATDLLRRDIAVIVNIAPGEGPFLERIGLTDTGIRSPFRPMMQARRHDGTMVPVEASLGVMPLDDGVHIVASFRDVSDREKIERIKDQFLSTVSHELRTPLTSIVGSLGLLQGGAVEILSPGAQRLVVIAENNANRLIRIVNDLLDVERLEKGKMEFAFTPLDLRATVQSAVDAVRGMAAMRDIAMETTLPDQPVSVRGDHERLIQVVNNLLSNAIRFSPRSGEVGIEVRIDGHAAKVCVADSGPGIDPDLRERLFTRFAQGAQPKDAQTPGTGLGLAIAREIVHNHGGTLDYDDASTDGARFTFTLPLWNALTGQDDLNGAPRLLLFVDEGEAATIASDFAARAIRADVVTDIDKMLGAVETRAYLAIVIDFQFAGDQALPLLHRIRALPSGQALPVIAIAGEVPAPAEAAKIGALDIVEWVAKPIARTALDTAIAAAIARASVTMPLILHIDDDSDTLEITAHALSGIARVARATDLRSARAFLGQNRPDIVIIDIDLPDGSGLDILREMTDGVAAAPPVIVYSAQDSSADIPHEVEAVLTKSRRSLPNLVDTIQSIVDTRRKGDAA